MRNIEVLSPQNVVIRFRLASLGARLSAYLIDILIISLFYIFIFFFAIMPFADMEEGFLTLVLLIGSVLMAGMYHLLMETFNNGQSIGKRAMNIRVTDENGSTPGFMQLFMRWLLRIVDITISSGGIAILAIAFSEKGQRLGDFLGRTIVVDLHTPKNVSLAEPSPRQAQPKPKAEPKLESAIKESNPKLENNLRQDDTPVYDEEPAEDFESPELESTLAYPEVAQLSETDIRKMDALYRKVRNGTYDIEVKRKLLTRMKIALEKKMGTSSREDTITAFLKQVFADFHAHQKNQESRGGW